jgi:DNA ligase (NAD+)
MKLRTLIAALAAVILLPVFAADNARPTTTPDAREKISALRREIAHHDELYHRSAAPEISDSDYDQLKRRLAALEREFPDVARTLPAIAEVGDDRSGLFQTYRHRERMMSLDKAYTEAELRAFHARLAKALGRRDLAFVVEPKFDGLAVSVTFQNGKLVRAVTRGNGVEGDDITANALQIHNLPPALRGADFPDVVEMRGEIYVSFAEFERINAEREAAGQSRFANPRNLAAGTVRQLDAREVARRGLQLVFYGIGACEPAAKVPASQRALHAAITAWGLPGVRQTWPAVNADELVRAVETVGRARSGFTFPTDGAVVKLDSAAQQGEAGVGEHAPRWAVAYKFAPERAETQLLAITLQVGRTGVLTPVAELAPVSLSGSMIARATLHNRDEIARRDIRIGDFVFIEKAGEVIPAIVGVNIAKRPATAQPFAFPSACPDCGDVLAQREGEVAVRCVNAACPAQLRRRLEHFASKDCLAIEGLGPALIEALVAKVRVRDLPDLYRLTRAEVLTLGRNFEKSADRVLVAIERSKNAELWRVIHGLGLPKVGVMGAKELAQKHGSLEALANGEPAQRALIAELLAVGVRPIGPSSGGTRLAGKNFVLTGALPTFTRAQATARIEAAGGKVAGSVSRATHYVVAGADPGAKLEQAKKLGVAVIDEAAFVKLLAGE